MSEDTETEEFFDAVESLDFATEEDLKDMRIQIEKTINKFESKKDMKLRNEFIQVLTKIKDELIPVKNTKEDSEIEISETFIESTKTSILSITDNKVQSVIEEKVQIRDKDQTFEEFHDPQMNFKTTVRIKM